MSKLIQAEAPAVAPRTSITNLDGDELHYLEQSGQIVIDQGEAAGIWTERADLYGMVLTVSVEGMSATQILSVRDRGLGEIGYSDGVITYRGHVIGEATGQAGGPLTITLLSLDTSAFSALLQNLTFEDTSDAPESGGRIIIALAHPDEEELVASASVVLSFIPVDDPLRAGDDAFPIVAGDSVIGNVKDNDLDPDDPGNGALFDVAGFNAGAAYEHKDPRKETINTSVSGVYGTLTLNADGTFEYIADNASAIAVGATSLDVFSYSIRGADGSLAMAQITFEIAGQPSLAISDLDGDILIYPERSWPLLLDEGLAASVDGTLTDFDGLVLRVSIDDASGTELVSLIGQGSGPGQIDIQSEGAVFYEGTEIGSMFSEPGGPLAVLFNENATSAAVSAVVRRLAYEDYSHAPADKQLSVTLLRGSAILSISHVTVQAQPVADDPVAGLDTAAVLPGETCAGDVLLNDHDPDDASAVLTISGFNAGTSASSAAAVPGSTIQGRYGALTLNANGTYSYSANNAGSIPVGRGGEDVFTYTAVSSAGGSTTGTLTVIVDNSYQYTLFPISNLNTEALHYSEQSGSIRLDDDVSVSSGGLGWHGVELDITVVGAATGERVFLPNQGGGAGKFGFSGSDITHSGVVIGHQLHASSGKLTIIFNGVADDEIVTALLRSLHYDNPNEVYQPDDRGILVSTRIGGVPVGFASTWFRLEPVEDPLTAVDDFHEVAEDLSLSGNVFTNDVDPDQSPYTVRCLTLFGAQAGEGVPAAQAASGQLRLEGSYGTLTLNQDGSFNYHANRADHLVDGEIVEDVFTYRVRNDSGDESVARIGVRVVGSNEIVVGSPAADLLLGGRGADQLSGGDGNDRLVGRGGKDILKGGKGKDVFVFETPADGGDSILDFRIGEDRIQLIGKAFGLKKGKLKADAFYKLKKGSLKAGERDDRVLYDQKKGILYADLDGSGKKKPPIVLGIFKNKPALSPEDFSII